MRLFRALMRRLLPSRSRDNLDRATERIRAVAKKIEEAPPEVKARTGRIFLEASGPHVDPTRRTSTA